MRVYFIGISASTLTLSLFYLSVSGLQTNNARSTQHANLNNLAGTNSDNRRAFLHTATAGTIALIYPSNAQATQVTKYYVEPAGVKTRDLFRSPEAREIARQRREQLKAKDPRYIEARIKAEAEEKAQKVEEERRLVEEERQRVELLTRTPPDVPRVLLLGGTGQVGKQVRKELEENGVFVVATSRDGREGTIELDVTKCYSKISDEVKQLAKDNRCSAVVSLIGAIGSKNDMLVNGADAQAAIGAREQPCVRNFVAITPSPTVKANPPAEVVQFVKAKGFSEEVIVNKFGNGGADGFSYTVISPGAIGKSKNYGKDPSVPLNDVVGAVLVGASAFYIGESSLVLDTPEKIKSQADKVQKLKKFMKESSSGVNAAV